MNKKLLISLFIKLIIAFSILIILREVAVYLIIQTHKPEVILSFEECVAKNYPVMESYPRQCRTPDGKTFVENIGNELEKADLIQSHNPRPNQTIISPLFIKGEARGYWFFEASFPIKLLDGNNKEIALTIAQAKSDWMTEDFVSFEAVLQFTTPETKEGTLVFKKDNPSGLPEHDDELIIPIKFFEAVQNVQLYYYNQSRDQEMFDYISCGQEAILPISREIALTQTPIQDTINLLLQGNLTPGEKQAGFSPMFPLEGLKLVGANLKDGTLTLEFDDPLNLTGGGSCRVGILWNQIKKTAQQFSGVKDVRFLPEELFQP
ncbi:GerMN domain-containing protein [Patescibacteria group bacterium]|nr:GerMN domain-containing protein [Patescibacteria group bacterium]